MSDHPFREIPAIREDIKKFLSDAPLKEVLAFIEAFDDLGAGEIVRKVLIVWIDQP